MECLAKFFLIEEQDPVILHDQYHGCWWHGTARIQVISSHGITYKYKSDIKHQNTLGCLEQYTAPNSQYTGGECPPPCPKLR